MKIHYSKKPFKLNKSKFPLAINYYLDNGKYSKDNPDREATRQLLRSWYKETFQKSNRWNKTLINRIIKNYSEKEISELRHYFEQLFDASRKYNQIFIKYIEGYIEKQKTSEFGSFIKIDQKGYEELLGVIGDLKQSGNIQSNYKEIAEVIYEFIQSDINLKISTIQDRIRNKKGYK